MSKKRKSKKIKYTKATQDNIYIRIESNPRLGLYQVRAHIFGKDFMFDKDAMTLEDALIYAEVVRQHISKDIRNELPYESVAIDYGSVEKNKHVDITTAKYLKEKLIAPVEQDDFIAAPAENGEDEIMVSARGILKMALSIIKNETEEMKPVQICTAFMNEVYKLCAMRRYGKTQEEIKREVDAMDLRQSLAWGENVFDEYVFQNDILEIFGRVSAK